MWMVGDVYMDWIVADDWDLEKYPADNTGVASIVLIVWTCIGYFAEIGHEVRMRHIQNLGLEGIEN